MHERSDHNRGESEQPEAPSDAHNEDHLEVTVLRTGLNASCTTQNIDRTFQRLLGILGHASNIPSILRADELAKKKIARPICRQPARVETRSA